MRIAVAGGTGTVGKYVVLAGQQSGHDMVVLSRQHGVDIQSGKGLAPALEGCAVIVDAANLVSPLASKSAKFFTEGTAHLHEAGTAAGVSHLVTLSIVGIDLVPGYGYYKAKLKHEAAALAGPLPATIVRATQFHEFPAQILSVTRRGPIAFMPRMRSQPISARTLGHVLVEIALGPPNAERIEVGGPEALDMVDMARLVLKRSGKRSSVIPLRVPGKPGRAMRSGALLPGEGGRLEGPTFAEWLEGDDVLAFHPLRP
jgi:uncharacterized protein YbjT (DUF2867 family)